MKKELLSRTKVFVLDLDGTIYLGDTLIDGTRAFLDAARTAGKDILFYTNNSSRSPESGLKKLHRLGIEATRDDFMTSTDVLLSFLKKEAPDSRVYLIGTPDLEACFKEAGIILTNHGTDTYRYDYGLTANARVAKEEQPDIVVAGFDLTFNYEKLERACAYIQNGALFYGLHPDMTCPTEYGAIPDCGAVCAAITAVTGVAPRYFGKPYPETVEAVVRRFDVDKEAIAFVGDRLYTDIAAGCDNGALGFLVLTGEAKESDLPASRVQPSAVFSSVKEMAKLLSRTV